MAETQLPPGITREDARRVLRRVLEAEEDRLHMDTPQGINNAIEEIIREEVD